MAQIKHLEQMVAESQATVEKMREDFRIAEMERERQRKIDEEERKLREAEFKEKSLERDVYIAKIRAEILKQEKDSEDLILIWILTLMNVILSMTAIVITVFK